MVTQEYIYLLWAQAQAQAEAAAQADAQAQAEAQALKQLHEAQVKFFAQQSEDQGDSLVSQDEIDFIKCLGETSQTYPRGGSKNNKYDREIVGKCGKSVTVDVYRVLDSFEVTNPQLQHLIEKGLCAGLRGHKDERQDLLGIQESIVNAIKMYDDKYAEKAT